eukprot:TRINITY_DN347_c0_g1_i1.p1 TRINITY_DN347_c0_g1~~TRINITY_DN347_c0_g1_i1.p1  ORF type:complete len:715 (-),score=143.85 TRINITY_DN347_c0_g1_i1:661-2805(-)
MSQGKGNDQEVEEFMKKKSFEIQKEVSSCSNSPQRMLDKMNHVTVSPNKMIKLSNSLFGNTSDTSQISNQSINIGIRYETIQEYYQRDTVKKNKTNIVQEIIASQDDTTRKRTSSSLRPNTSRGSPLRGNIINDENTNPTGNSNILNNTIEGNNERVNIGTVINTTQEKMSMSQKLALLYILGLYPVKEEKALPHMISTVEDLSMLNGSVFKIPHESQNTFLRVTIHIRMISDLKSRRLLYSYHMFLLIIFIIPDNEAKAQSVVIKTEEEREQYYQKLNNRDSEGFKELLKSAVTVHNYNKDKPAPTENRVFYDLVHPTSKTCGSDFTIALRICTSCKKRGSSCHSPFLYDWTKKINEKQVPKDVESLMSKIEMIKKVDRVFANKLDKEVEKLKILIPSALKIKVKKIWEMIIKAKQEKKKQEMDFTKDPKTVNECEKFVSVISRFDRTFSKDLEKTLNSKKLSKEEKVKEIAQLIRAKRKDFPNDFENFCVACYFLYTSKNALFYIVSEDHLLKLVRHDLEYDSCILHLPIRFGESCVKEVAILVVTVTGNFDLFNDVVKNHLQSQDDTQVAVLSAHWSTKYKDQAQFSHISKCMVELSTRDGTALLRFFEKGPKIMTDIFEESKKYTQDTFETIDESFAENISHRLKCFRDNLFNMQELLLPHSPNSPFENFRKKSAKISDHPQLIYQVSKLVESIDLKLMGHLEKIKLQTQ